MKQRLKGITLLVPVGPLAGTPLQRVTVEIEGEQKALGPPSACLRRHQDLRIPGRVRPDSLPGKTAQGHVPIDSPRAGPAKFLTQRDIPGRDVSDRKPAFHVYNRIGMLNDPNGLVYYNDEWHLFHQFALQPLAYRLETLCKQGLDALGGTIHRAVSRCDGMPCFPGLQWLMC